MHQILSSKTLRWVKHKILISHFLISGYLNLRFVITDCGSILAYLYTIINTIFNCSKLWCHLFRKSHFGLAFKYILSSLQDSVVWEITGAEFTKAEIHTADGISIRFPRCTKMRDDKSWKEATNLHELNVCVNMWCFIISFIITKGLKNNQLM